MSKELEPAATGKSGRRGNEIFWTHPTKSGIIVARAVSRPDDKTRCGT